MPTFSRRYGYNTKDIQLECASDTLKKRIFASFYKQEYDAYDAIDYSDYTTGIEDMMIEMGIPYQFPKNEIYKMRNSEDLQKHIIYSREWYVIFDFIERYLNIASDETADKMTKCFNRILEDEASAYRIIDKQVVPITNEMELSTIYEAMQTPFPAVNTHISKALNLFADRQKPDYENSIKESISAIESMCCIIAESSGSEATLGKAIKRLKENGINIHPCVVSAFEKLYGYTSDEDGIRHGGIDFKGAPAEDAKFMLISCSAFINYLIEKRSKILSGR